MSSRLIEACLKVPALRREMRVSNLDAAAKTRERRERDEWRSNQTRLDHERQRAVRHERGGPARRDELERSILDLRNQLKQETTKHQLRKALIKRVLQTSYAETPLSRAALSERDRMVQEVMSLYRQLREADDELENLADVISRLTKKNEAHTVEENTRKRQRMDEESDKVKRIKRESAALRRLYFALIMESGVEWLDDDALSEIVWSLR